MEKPTIAGLTQTLTLLQQEHALRLETLAAERKRDISALLQRAIAAEEREKLAVRGEGQAHEMVEIRFDERAAGIYLGGADNPISPRTMQRWRLEGIGPKFVKVGPHVIRYEKHVLDAFLAAGERTSTGDAAGLCADEH